MKYAAIKNDKAFIFLIHCWWECKMLAILEDSLAASYKAKHSFTIQSSNYTPWYLPKWVETLCPDKKLHVDVYISFTHNFKKLDVLQVRCPSIGEWINTLWYSHTMEYYLVIKKYEQSSYKKTQRTQSLYCTPETNIIL